MGKGAILKGRNKENIYPVTASDLVFDPVSKKNVKAELSEKVEEAPMDGKQYARMGGAWAEVEAGAVSETVLIAITPALSELHGVDVRVTTNEGDTVLDTPWTGAQLSCQVRAGLQYTVSVGSKDGFIAPEPLTYTAVKGATRTVNMSYIESRLKVSILSNQGEDSAISGVKATVKYGSTTVQVSNGGTVNLPLDVDVTITFPSVNGYKTPDAITYHHDNGGYEKSGTYQTELVKVTLSASNGASVNGQIVTINGVEYTWNGTAITQKVAFGTTYDIVVNEKSGYTAPSMQTFTASEVFRNITLVYENISYGLYIQGISGKLYPKDQGYISETINGIVFITEQCSFVARLDVHNSPDALQIYNNDYTYPSLSPITDDDMAILDFNGQENTKKMLEKYGNSDVYAAGYCAGYIFPNGQKGYLGAAGELAVLASNWLDYLDIIINRLNLSGSVVVPEYYWSSSRAEDIDGMAAFWYFYKSESTPHNNIELSYGDGMSAIPFAPYIANPQFITFTIEGAEYKCLEGTTWKEWCGSKFNNGQYTVKADGKIGETNFQNKSSIYIEGTTQYVQEADVIKDGWSYRDVMYNPF